MMLLSAVILIFAFLALSAMVARVSQLGSVTGQDQARPILLEVESVREAVDDLVVGLQEVTPDLNATSTPTLQEALVNGLRHLARLEEARGFRFQDADTDTDPFDVADLLPCATGVGRVQFSLTDGDVRVVLLSQQTFPC